MKTFKITLLQTDIIWENPAENRRQIESILGKEEIKTDAILLPEMFNTGFTMNSSSYYEEMNGETVQWMAELAGRYFCSIGGSLIIKSSGKVFNRFIWIHSNGHLSFYDKRHLFFLERESGNYTPGCERIIVDDGGLRILLATCYDLRFPVWLRNKNDYDAIFLVANWPASRREVWIKLIMARAIENQCYIAAVNRTGSDGNGLAYSGDSMIVDPRGNPICSAEDSINRSISALLNIDDLESFRKKFPVWQDADDFDLRC